MAESLNIYLFGNRESGFAEMLQLAGEGEFNDYRFV